MANVLKSVPGSAPIGREVLARRVGGGGLVFLLTSAFLFVPAAIHYLLGTSSNTIGLVTVCLPVCIISFSCGGFGKSSFARRATIFVLLISVLLIAHLGIAIYLPYIPQPIDLPRTGGSLIALVIMAATAGAIADWLVTAPPGSIDRIGTAVSIALILIGVWCFVGRQPPSPLVISHPAFPFTEPSHYALIAAPFIIHGCVRTTLPRRCLWLAIWLVIGFVNSSFSMLIVVAIAALVSLPVIYLSVSVAVAGILAAGFDLRYYTERLDFSANSDNLSALVYRQGWELLHQGIVFSRGWGIGFQQLGFAPLNVPTSDWIYRILGDDANLRDGSFLVAKLVSELGFIGIGIAIWFTVEAVRAGWRLRSIVLGSAGEYSASVKFCLSMICAFSVEMFVRGIGYFSGTVVLFIASVLALKALHNHLAVHAKI